MGYVTNLWEAISALWPILAFVFGFGIWALQKQTVSQADFTSLEIRLTLVEEKLPSKNMIIETHARLVRVETKIEQLSGAMERIESRLYKKYETQ